MKCECGYIAATPFCGMCGAVLTKKPLVELLAYVRQHAATALRNYNVRCADNGIYEMPRNVARWQEWEQALVEVLKE